MSATVDDTSAPTYDPYPLDLGALLRLAGVGVITGVTGWLLYLVISQYFIQPVFCESAATFAVCRNGGTIAWFTSHVIVLAAAVALLARFAIYRPLLVVLAVFAALWSAHAWLGTMIWYMGGLWQAILFGIAFAAFGWLARAAHFIVSLILVLLLVVAARAILVFA